MYFFLGNSHVNTTGNVFIGWVFLTNHKVTQLSGGKKYTHTFYFDVSHFCIFTFNGIKRERSHWNNFISEHVLFVMLIINTILSLFITMLLFLNSYWVFTNNIPYNLLNSYFYETFWFKGDISNLPWFTQILICLTVV